MKLQLNFELNQNFIDLISLGDNEGVVYCIPVDIDIHGSYTDTSYITVTENRLIIITNGEISFESDLSSLEDITCEALAGCGALVHKTKSGDAVLARFTMRHLTRVHYIATGIRNLKQGERKRITATETEKTCLNCGKPITKSETCVHCKGRFSSFLRFIIIMKPWTSSIIFITVIMLLSTVFNISNTFAQRYFIDDILMKRSGTSVVVAVFVALLFIFAAAQMIFRLIFDRKCVKLGSDICRKMRDDIFAKIQENSITFIHRRKEGDLLNRIMHDTRHIQDFFQRGFAGFFSTILTMIAMIIVMFIINWRLTIYSLIFVPFIIIMFRVFFKRIFFVFHSMQHRYDNLASALQDVLSGIREVKAYGLDKRESERFNGISYKYTVTQKRNETFWAIFYPILTMLLSIGTYLVVIFGGAAVLKQDMSVGQYTQFMAAAGMLYTPLSWLSFLPRMIIMTLTAFERISDILNTHSDIEYSGQVNKELEGNVVFDKVGFGYTSYEPVLEDISFEAKTGDFIGLVGASGVGKSTLINLVMRLYDVESGNIYIDGTDIKSIDHDALHRNIGVVLQDTFMFTGTVLENLTFSKPDADFEEVINAAKLANAHDFICKLPDGYDTKIGEKGHTLSGGERQRLAIARAVLPNPKILILDEATSSLDTQSEELIQQAFARLSEGRTTFAIAHRLSTLRNATRIIVLDKKRIVESGTHSELSVIDGGVYAGLVRAQLNMFSE